MFANGRRLEFVKEIESGMLNWESPEHSGGADGGFKQLPEGVYIYMCVYVC